MFKQLFIGLTDFKLISSSIESNVLYPLTNVVLHSYSQNNSITKSIQIFSFSYMLVYGHSFLQTVKRTDVEITCI